MRPIKLLLILLCLVFAGCRCGVVFYGAVGHQSIDRVVFELINQEADPNILEAGEAVGAIVKGAAGI